MSKCWLAMVVLLLASAQARSATITVTTTADEFGTNVFACSLREAIQAANTHAAFGGCPAGDIGGNAIELPDGTYALTLTGPSEDNNASGDLDIRSNMSIYPKFGGPAQVIIDGSHGFDRIFDVRNAGVSLTGLTLQGGAADPGSGQGGAILAINAVVNMDTCLVQGNLAAYGGGIYVSGTSSQVTIVRSSIVNNDATQFGGGIAMPGLFGSNKPSLDLRTTTISGNFSHSGGGGIEVGGGTLTLNNVTVAYNEANFVNSMPKNGGGGILVAGGTIIVRNSVFADNRAHAWLKPDCDGTFDRFDHSLISDSTGCNFPVATGSLFDVEPRLAPLFDYGANTLSHHPRQGSPVIDAGDHATCEVMDQRGRSSQRLTCDIGAIQWIMDFTVDRTDDVVDDKPGDGVCHVAGGGCTLRAAIMESNAAIAVNGFSSILLPAHAITLSLPGADEDGSTTGDLDIHKQVNIFGTLPMLFGRSVVDANHLDRAFDIDTTAALVDVDIRNGRPPQNVHQNDGGGLLVTGRGGVGAHVLLSHVLVTGNTGASGGAIAVFGPPGKQTPHSILHADHCGIADNVAGFLGSGGGMVVASNAEAVLNNCTVGANQAYAYGGGISNSGILSLYNSTVAFNIANSAAAAYPDDNSGGGVSNSSSVGYARLSNTILAGNLSGKNGGGYVPADCKFDFYVDRQNIVQTQSPDCHFFASFGGALPIAADPQLLTGFGDTLYPLKPTSPAYGAVPNGDYPNDQCRGEIVGYEEVIPLAYLQLDDQIGNARPAGGLLPTPCSIGAYEGYIDEIFRDGFQ